MEPAHKALLDEIRRRLDETRDDPDITNSGGSNYWGPHVTRAINGREDDGPALVEYIRSVIRKSGQSDGWSALREADRLDLSFEDMVAKADEPIRALFTDEDREIAARALSALQSEADRRRDAAESEAVEYDRKIVRIVGESRLAKGKSWTPEMEAEMLAGRAARRSSAS